MNCDPGAAVYVGDSLVDFEAAEAAGMEPVVIRRDGFGDVRQSEVDALIAEEGDSGRFRVIESLYELVEIGNGL
jgi:phosphoglycolate phosphatase-like HAD superfamily hydrolase